ncbi:hypothetical protein Tco_0732402 [Tanacetum coccineum]
MAQQLGLLSNLRAYQRDVDLFEYHFQVLLMISEAKFQVLADIKSILSINCCTTVKGRVDGLVKEVEELEVKLVIRVVVGLMNKENNRNQNGNAINDNIQGDVRNVIVNNGRRGFSYKDFLACHLKEYDRKGGAIVCTCYIEKMESVQDMSRCRDDQKVKYIAGLFVVMLYRVNSQITHEAEDRCGMAWERL